MSGSVSASDRCMSESATRPRSGWKAGMRRGLYYGVMPTVGISARGEQRVRGGHPWVYRSDVVDVQAEGGDIVRVLAAPEPGAQQRRGREGGRTIGYALFSDRSQIPIRMLSRGDAVADESLVRARLEA